MSIELAEESVVDFWDSMPRDWPNKSYDVQLAEGIADTFERLGSQYGHEITSVLDCGCGTGNPSIGLASRDFNLFCLDSDPSMVDRFRENCKAAEVSLEVIAGDWRDVSPRFFGKATFDAALCRGNSLIYAGSWERSSFIPNVAETAIRKSVRSIASAIGAGGFFYVDLTSQKEYEATSPVVKFVGSRLTEDAIIALYWISVVDWASRTRKVHCKRIFHDRWSGEVNAVKTHSFVSYLLRSEELVQMCEAAGLELLESGAEVPGEDLYDVYLFRKV